MVVTNTIITEHLTYVTAFVLLQGYGSFPCGHHDVGTC
jgi:hypothetical protein